MNNNYHILDTRVFVSEDRTTTVRMNATSGTSQVVALQWIFGTGRITDFSGEITQCRKINRLVADLTGDVTFLSGMDEFASTHTN
jgi:hypothetical protein